MGRKKKVVEAADVQESNEGVSTLSATPKVLASTTKHVQLRTQDGDTYLMPKTEASIVTYGDSTVQDGLDDLMSNAVRTVSASGTSPLTLSASKSGTTVTVSGSVNLANYATTANLSNAYNQANSAYNLANTANATANSALTNVSASGTSPLTLSASKSGTVVTISGSVNLSNYATTANLANVYNQANAAYNAANSAQSTADSAYSKANDAYTLANTANATANTANATAKNAYNAANTAQSTADDAYAKANSAYTLANTANATANTANTTAKNAYNQANNAYNQANSANTLATSANTLASTANTTAANAYNQANSAYSLANSANTLANTANANANSANTTAKNAYNQANSAYSAANSAQSTADSKQDKLTAGTGISISSNTISCTLDTTIGKVVTSLPNKPDSGDENKIFFVPSAEQGNLNIYTEYIYINAAWEELGQYKSDIDLSGYLTIANAANTYATQSDLNTVSNTVNNAYSTANSAYSQANNAYNQANSANTLANTANATANTANSTASSAYSQANNAYNAANSANTLANTANTTASSAYNQANSAYNLANTANATANSALTNVSASGTSPLTLSASKSGTTVSISGSVNLSNYATTANLANAYNQANAAYNQANSAYNQANTANATANSALDAKVYPLEIVATNYNSTPINSSFTFNGTTTTDSSRGISVYTINRSTLAVSGKTTFDTYSADQTIVDNFIDFINDISDDYLILLLVRDSSRCTSSMREAIANIGGLSEGVWKNDISATGERRSHYVVGMKGLKAGQGYEEFADEVSETEPIMATIPIIKSNGLLMISKSKIGASNVIYDGTDSVKTILGSAYNQANAAYNQANSANTLATTANTNANSANTTAKNAYNQANAAYNQANSAYNLANTANATANTANSTASSAYSQANAAYNQANSAYNQANTANTNANTANATANNAYNQANSAYSQANNAYNAANSANSLASTANTTAANAYSQANNAYNQANSAYDLANTANSSASNAVMNANLAYNQANSAYNLANTANATANSAVASVSASGTSPLTLSASKSGTAVTISGSVDLSDYAKTTDLPTLSGLGGVGSVSASGTSPLSLSASKSGTSVSISGSVDLSSYAKTTDVEAVATQAQTNAEAIEGIGILPFAGFYSVNYTFTSGDIVWVRDGNYFARINAVDSGTYQVNKLADGDYNSGGVARTDRLYRCYYEFSPNSDYYENNKMGVFTLYRNDPYQGILLLVSNWDLDYWVSALRRELSDKIDTLQEQLAETPNINIIPYPFPNGKKGNQVFDSDTQITTVAFDGLLQNYYGEIHSNGYDIGFNDTATITVSTTGYFTFSCMARAVEGYDQPATINFLMFAEGSINMLDGVTLSTTTWTRISATGTFSSGTISGGSVWITVTSGARVQLGNFKLEAGSTATAWQPSLRDLGLF